MMKLYVAYSYYNDDVDPEPLVCIFGVFSTREQAEEIIKKDKASYGPGEKCLDTYEIKEVTLDEPTDIYYEDINEFGFFEEDDGNES